MPGDASVVELSSSTSKAQATEGSKSAPDEVSKVVPDTVALDASVVHTSEDTAHDHLDSGVDTKSGGQQNQKQATNGNVYQDKPDTEALQYKVDVTPLPPKSDALSSKTNPVGTEASPPAVRAKDVQSPLNSTVSPMSQPKDNRTAEEVAAAKKAIDAHLTEINNAATAKSFSEHGYPEDVLKEDRYQTGATTPASVTPKTILKPNVIKALLSRIGFGNK